MPQHHTHQQCCVSQNNILVPNLATSLLTELTETLQLITVRKYLFNITRKHHHHITSDPC